jgi:hypothetical protein
LHIPIEGKRFVKKKIGKIILFVVCSLVAYAAISAALRSWEEKKLKREIADIRRTLREQGFKTEMADFKITTDPTMRARVKTLLALGYEPQLDTNDDRLDFRPVITNGSATVMWKQDSLPLGTNTYQWADFRATLDKERERLDAACDAALAGPIQFDMDLRNHADPWIDNLPHLHHLSQTFGNRVLLALHDGHPDEAWINLLATTRLVTAWKVEPALISHGVRSAMADDTFAVTWQALQFSHWPDDRLSVLQTEWESADFLTNLSESMGLVRVDDIATCQKLSELPLSGIFSLSGLKMATARSWGAGYQDAKYDLQQMLYRGNMALTDEKNLLLYFRDRELELRHAIQSPSWEQMRVQPGITNPPPFTSPSPDVGAWIRPDFPLAFRLTAVVAAAETERRMLITAIALERYRGKYGAYPPILKPLAPEFVKAVPLDFMDGQPLRYRPTADGHFSLYSVGLDCVDDNGKPPPPDSPRFFAIDHENKIVVTNVDIVWPAPATP